MSSVKIEVDLRRYLHEKAQESRKNEVEACLMFVAGAMFFVSGVLINLKVGGVPEWFLIIPYHRELDAGPILGLSLTISGLILMFIGMIITFHHRRERKWFIMELRKVYEKELKKADLKKVLPHDKEFKKKIQ